MLLSVIIGVRLSALFSYQRNNLHSAAPIAVQGHVVGNQTVKDSGVWGFWLSLLLFSLLAAVLVTRIKAVHFLCPREQARHRPIGKGPPHHRCRALS
jgi:vitamin B12/bleomycin/antimicrobial peptide transport system ATP-binding/permease protein